MKESLIKYPVLLELWLILSFSKRQIIFYKMNGNHPSALEHVVSTYIYCSVAHSKQEFKKN